MKISLQITLLVFFTLFGTGLKSQTFKLSDTNFEVGDVFICQIYFDYNGVGILPESFPLLDSVATFMQKNANLVIEIGNHTDYRGSDAYNMKLTERRSRMIKDYLSGKNISGIRLVAVGYGESRPIITPESIEKLKVQEEIETSHHTNRRTEFKILSLDFKE